jgi:hypothetical protein
MSLFFISRRQGGKTQRHREERGDAENTHKKRQERFSLVIDYLIFPYVPLRVSVSFSVSFSVSLCQSEFLRTGSAAFLIGIS